MVSSLAYGVLGTATVQRLGGCTEHLQPTERDDMLRTQLRSSRLVPENEAHVYAARDFPPRRHQRAEVWHRIRLLEQTEEVSMPAYPRYQLAGPIGAAPKAGSTVRMEYASTVRSAALDGLAHALAFLPSSVPLQSSFVTVRYCSDGITPSGYQMAVSVGGIKEAIAL